MKTAYFAASAALMCTSIVAPVTAAEIPLGDPPAEYQFSRSEFKLLEWTRLAATGASSYSLVVKRVIGEQSDSEAMADNAVWFQDDFNWASPVGQVQTQSLVDKPLADEDWNAAFVWQVVGTTEAGAHASEVRRFYMPQFVETLHANLIPVKVTALTSPDLDNLGGTGTIAWSAPSMTVPVAFEGLEVEYFGGRHTLRSGTITGDFAELLPLSPPDGLPGTAGFQPGSLRIRPTGSVNTLELFGDFTWSISEDWSIQTTQGWIDATPQGTVYGFLSLPSTASFVRAAHLDVSFGQDSSFYLASKDFTPFLEFVFEHGEGDWLSVTLSHQQDLLGLDVPPESSRISPLASGELLLSVASATYDLDPGRALPDSSDPPEWEGLRLEDLTLEFKPGTLGHFGASADEASVDGNLTVDAEGFSGALESSSLGFETQIFGVDAVVQSISLSFEGGNVSSGGFLSGELSPGFQPTGFDYEFHLAVTGDGTANEAEVSGGSLEEPLLLTSSTALLFDITSDEGQLEIDEDAQVILVDGSRRNLSVELFGLGAAAFIDDSEVGLGGGLLRSSASQVVIVAQDGTEVVYKIRWEGPETTGEEPEDDLTLSPAELVSPEDGASIDSETVTVSWNAAPGTPRGTDYDVFVCTNEDFDGADCQQAVCSESSSFVFVPPRAPLPPSRWWLLVVCTGGMILIGTRARKAALLRPALIATALLSSSCVGSEESDDDSEETDESQDGDPNSGEQGDYSCELRDLSGGETYFWRVIASDGEEDAVSETKSFTLE